MDQNVDLCQLQESPFAGWLLQFGESLREVDLKAGRLFGSLLAGDWDQTRDAICDHDIARRSLAAQKSIFW